MSEQEQQQPIFNVERLYVKDLSLEVPHAPEVFLSQDALRNWKKNTTK